MPAAAGVVDEKGSEYMLAHTGPRELDGRRTRAITFLATCTTTAFLGMSRTSKSGLVELVCSVRSELFRIRRKILHAQSVRVIW